MDYETEITNGHKHIVRHFFKAHEIQVGSRWIGSSGGIVTVEGFNSYGSTDPWIEVVYSWQLNGEKFTHEKDAFAFQCRYCLIVEELK
jgi:hypothetical protein